MNEVWQVLADYGLPGVVIAALAIVAWSKDRDVKELTNKRVEEAKEVGQMVAEMGEKWSAALAKLGEGMRAQREGMAETRRVMERMNERMAECPYNRRD